MRIETTHVFPPIPVRQFDWSAVDADTYDPDPEAHSPVGWGATEADAITDLKTLLEVASCESEDGDEMCEGCDCWKHTRQMCG